MSDYGVTPNGFVRKRFDVILKEIQGYQSEKFGFDVSLNPQSFLNVINVGVADKQATLWELAEHVYFSMYPSSSEGVSLDFAMQFGGYRREPNKRTKYPVPCTGNDGTHLPINTTIASNTTPRIYFKLFSGAEISRKGFNKCAVTVVSAMDNTNYTVTINGVDYTYKSGTDTTAADILAGLASVVTPSGFTVSVVSNTLSIADGNAERNSSLQLSDNLTTISVTSIIVFESIDYGKFDIPEGNITLIITPVSGFKSCTNLGNPEYGRIEETDVEARQSYIRKISSRSSTMLESISAAILQNVKNVISARGYENTTDYTDAEGRPPHSIEFVVDGGGNADIAAEILRNKSGGIQTFGSVSVDVPDLYGDTITIKFNRPAIVYVWMKVVLTTNPSEAMPPNYADLIKKAIVAYCSTYKAGNNVIPQDFISYIKSIVSGIAYIDINAYSTTNGAYTPVSGDYTLKNIFLTSRQKASVAYERIEVTLSV